MIDKVHSSPFAVIRFARTAFCASVLLVSALAGRTHAASAETTSAFGAANEAFGAGKYLEAIAGYEKITKTNGYSAAVLFNLGNAYYHNGQTGLAILNYERALRLSPRDPDIQANLKYARTQANLSQPTERWWRVALHSLTPNQWAWLASSFFMLLCVLILLRMLNSESIQRLGVSATLEVPAWRLILFLVGFGLFLAISCGAMSVQERHEAIVIAREASLLVTPFDKSQTLATLPEGEAVNAEKKYGDYILVRYESDKVKSGWVSQSQIAPVEPDLLAGAP